MDADFDTQRPVAELKVAEELGECWRFCVDDEAACELEDDLAQRDRSHFLLVAGLEVGRLRLRQRDQVGRDETAADVGTQLVVGDVGEHRTDVLDRDVALEQLMEHFLGPAGSAGCCAATARSYELSDRQRVWRIEEARTEEVGSGEKHF